MSMKKKIWIIVLASVAAIALAVTAVIAMSSGEAKKPWQEQYDLGVRYLSNGNYEEAVIAFTAAIEIDPKNPNLFIGRADAYMGLGDTIAARADYETALGLDETLADAWLGLAETYIEDGNLEKALELLREAAEKTEDDRIVAKIAELEDLLHVHTWAKATCTAPKTCTECGATEGESLGHTWIDATCTEPKTCPECGETEGEPLGHDMLPATTESPSTCSRCGYTEGEPLSPEHVHTWAEATCTVPRTCTECGTIEGEPLGHDMLPATVDSPSTCSRCGHTEGEPLSPEHVHTWVDATCTAPQTCTECGATEGTALGHTWSDATCTLPKTCSRCGTTDGMALGHDMRPATYEVPATCSRCGYTEGEPLETEPTIPPTNPNTYSEEDVIVEVSTATGQMDLTAMGNLDWYHGFAEGGGTRKAKDNSTTSEVVGIIDFGLIGKATMTTYFTDSPVAYFWSDGFPNQIGSDDRTGGVISYRNEEYIGPVEEEAGWFAKIPAGESFRTLTIVSGIWRASGIVQVYANGKLLIYEKVLENPEGDAEVFLYTVTIPPNISIEIRGILTDKTHPNGNMSMGGIALSEKQ